MDVKIESKNVEKHQLAILEEYADDGMSVPNWLIDVLKWISRIEMANSSLSFSCRMFKQLCWSKMHGNVKPHSVEFLEYCYENENLGNVPGIFKDRHKQIIPCALTTPPEYILGFEQITICFLDIQIIEFIKNIALEEINLSMDTSMQKWQENDITLMGSLLSIFAKNIYGLQICNYLDANCFLDFNRQFPTCIDRVLYLDVTYIVDLDLDILFNWLMKPRTDGGQKILYFNLNFAIIDSEEQQQEMELLFINRIKEEFLHSKERNNFLIQLEEDYDQFSLQNEQTGEVLNLYHEMDLADDELYFFIARYPKGEEHWKEESRDKICGKRNTADINISLDLNDGGFFQAGSVIGLGIVHSQASSPRLKCFAMYNGELLGMVKLPAKFARVELFPAVNLNEKGDSIHANFGRNKWHYHLEQIIQNGEIC